MYRGYAQRRAPRSAMGISLDEVVNAAHLQEALMRYTVKQPGPEACWLWDGPKLSYHVQGRWMWRAQLFVLLEKGYTRCSPARLAYLFDAGTIPERHRIVHTCHQSLCVRPSHIQLAGQSKHYWSKVRPLKRQQEREAEAAYWAERAVAGVSGDTVEQVRFYHWLGEPVKSIAKNFGLKQAVVERILEQAETPAPIPISQAHAV